MVWKSVMPPGWQDVQPVGQPIPGTRFIAFKVPLKGLISRRLKPTQKFTPKDLIAAMKALNVQLGLIIDLTYTTKYYDAKDLPKNVEYKKLFTVGHSVPDDATILLFKKSVRKFLWENTENEKLIGVHCTNGINRTGYLICRYLIDVEGWHPITAIRVFGEARGHHMDGKRYLADLRTQPMRSNLEIDLWDADGDTVPPPNNVDGHIDRLSSEEYPRPAKRLKVYDDDHSDLPEQIRLREFDFIKKGPGQQRKLYYDQQFQDDPEPLVEKRQSHFADHQLYDGCQEEMQLKDFDFATRESGKRLRSCHDHHLCDDIPESAQLEDMNMGHGQRHFPDVPPHSDKLIDSQFSRDQGQRKRRFYDNMQYKLFIERDCPFFSQDRFPETPLFCRDYGSDKEDYHRNCRPDCSTDYRRTCSSDELIRERKTRLAPCSSHPVHINSSSHQEVSSVAVDHEREPHCEITREMGPGKRLPVVTIDYNYGLPLNYIVEEDKV